MDTRFRLEILRQTFSYPASSCRWQIAEHIGGADKLIQDFHAAAEKEGLNHRSHDLLILKEAIDGGYRIPIEGV